MQFSNIALLVPKASTLLATLDLVSPWEWVGDRAIHKWSCVDTYNHFSPYVFKTGSSGRGTTKQKDNFVHVYILVLAIPQTSIIKYTTIALEN